MTGIYRITNRRNGRVYIGSSIDVFRRWREHRNNLRGNKHPNRLIQEDWNLHGARAFKCEVIERVEEGKHLGERETYHIAQIPVDLLYNLTRESYHSPKGGKMEVPKKWVPATNGKRKKRHKMDSVSIREEVFSDAQE